VGPQVSQVVFDGGRRRAVSESARVGYDASVTVYRQNAIDAFREVEDNLAVLRSIFAPPLTARLLYRFAKYFSHD
jgi:outer membrane protein TolC